MREKITKRRIEAIRPKVGEDVFLWDTEIKGFGVRVKPSGVRSFVLSYYAPNLHQTRRRMTLGAFGPMTAEEARAKALDLLARVGRGEDPAQEESDERRSTRDNTVAALLQRYLDDADGLRRDSTLAYYKSLARLYLIPHLGPIPVAKVSQGDVVALHRLLKSKKVTANRVLQLVKAFYYWLERSGIHAGANPAANVDAYPEAARERFLTDEEIARLGDALRTAETRGLPAAPQHRKAAGTKRQRNAGMFTASPQPANPVVIAAIRLLILTGWREKEVLTLRWDAIDFSRGIATLQDTKAGRSIRHLSAAALELLASQPRYADSPYVFPGRNPGRPLREIQRTWYAVRHAAQLEEVRLHDLRHSVASTAAAQGHSLLLIAKLLGHKDQRSTLRYAHLADNARQRMADSVGQQISAALGSSA